MKDFIRPVVKKSAHGIGCTDGILYLLKPIFSETATTRKMKHE